jgi:hypothetical protein
MEKETENKKVLFKIEAEHMEDGTVQGNVQLSENIDEILELVVQSSTQQPLIGAILLTCADGYRQRMKEITGKDIPFPTRDENGKIKMDVPMATGVGGEA